MRFYDKSGNGVLAFLAACAVLEIVAMATGSPEWGWRPFFIIALFLYPWGASFWYGDYLQKDDSERRWMKFAIITLAMLLFWSLASHGNGGDEEYEGTVIDPRK